MTETVRLVADGEELVLWQGETARVRPRPAPRDAASPRAGEAARRPIAIRYQGFQDLSGRREYELHAQRGEQMYRYIVWIGLKAFSSHQALLQDGPDICYQKLLRELALREFQGAAPIEVTEDDLAAYRETHSPRPRKRILPSRP